MRIASPRRRPVRRCVSSRPIQTQRKAIEVSKSLGKGGTLRLFDASGGSFYDDLGFQVVDGQTKQLVGGIKSRS
jgi:vacuolar-type H+-ATPase subunit B/Vma2